MPTPRLGAAGRVQLRKLHREAVQRYLAAINNAGARANAILCDETADPADAEEAFTIGAQDALAQYYTEVWSLADSWRSEGFAHDELARLQRLGRRDGT